MYTHTEVIRQYMQIELALFKTQHRFFPSTLNNSTALLVEVFYDKLVLN